MKHNLKDIFEHGTEFVEKTVASIVAEVDRRKPVNPANENAARLVAPPAAKNSAALPVIDPRDWQGKTVPERKWFVEGMIHTAPSPISAATVVPVKLKSSFN